MEVIKSFKVKEGIADAIIEPALNPPLSIDIKNIAVSFPSSKRKGIFTAVKEIDLQVKKEKSFLLLVILGVASLL